MNEFFKSFDALGGDDVKKNTGSMAFASTNHSVFFKGKYGMKADKVTKVTQNFKTVNDGDNIRLILDCDNRILEYWKINDMHQKQNEKLYTIKLPNG